MLLLLKLEQILGRLITTSKCFLDELLLKSNNIVFSGSLNLCKGQNCKHSNSIRTVSFRNPRLFGLNDDAIDYDDKHIHFKHVRYSNKTRHHPLSVLPSRKISGTREIQPRDIQLPFTFPTVIIKCFNCQNNPPELQCGEDGREYENTCFRECEHEFFPKQIASSYPKVGLAVMGKCPQ